LKVAFHSVEIAEYYSAAIANGGRGSCDGLAAIGAAVTAGRLTRNQAA
jgi:hypothetical protein